MLTPFAYGLSVVLDLLVLVVGARFLHAPLRRRRLRRPGQGRR